MFFCWKEGFLTDGGLIQGISIKVSVWKRRRKNGHLSTLEFNWKGFGKESCKKNQPSFFVTVNIKSKI